MPNGITDNKIQERFVGLWLAVVLAMGYVFSLPAVPYPLDFLVKALPILCLAWLCTARLVGLLRWLMTAAMLFSATGDVFLALPFWEHSFAAGLGAFLCAQLVYCVVFLQRARLWRQRAVAVVLITLFYIAVLLLLLPRAGELTVPVAVYMTALCTMGLLACVYRGSPLVMWGALCFLASDSCIAINKFWIPFELSAHVIMVTYYMAQIFIVAGILQTSTRCPTEDWHRD